VRSALGSAPAGDAHVQLAASDLSSTLTPRPRSFELVAHPAFNADATECELSVRVVPAEPVAEVQAATGSPWVEFRFRMRCVEGGAFRGCWMTKYVEAPWYPHNYQ
jgi:hypothetical protein